MQAYSLATRLLVSAALLISVFLGLTGTALERAFKGSVLEHEREQLKTQTYLLLGALELKAGQVWLPAFLSEPRFNQLGSGLYGLVLQRGEVVWRSESSSGLNIDFTRGLSPLGEVGQERLFELTWQGEKYFVYQYRAAWEERELTEFTSLIVHEQSGLKAGQRQFQRMLWYWLGIATLALLILLLLVLRWGLRPLKVLARELNTIQLGEQRQLDGRYPAELKGVTDNLNMLIKHERQQRERYSQTMSDLAHSLKTPLAVMRGELEPRPDPVLLEQLGRMNDIISHQLQRAVRQYSPMQDQRVNVWPCVERVVTALQKIYAGKSIAVEYGGYSGEALAEDRSQERGECFFRGDERDLMELLGNILDNAFKHARRHIRIDCHEREGRLLVCIEDDGLGVQEEQVERVLQRGGRLDSQTPGQGIGLAVVVDIVASYGGSIDISSSAWGGACVSLLL